MFREQNSYDHIWTNRDIPDSRVKRRQQTIQYQNDLKSQIAENEARKKADKLYENEQNNNKSPLPKIQNYSPQSVIPNNGFSNQMFLSHMREPSFPSSVVPRKSQFAESLRAQIEETKRTGSSLNNVVPPLSSTFTAVPFSFGNTSFDESTFSFTPNQVKAFRALPASERSHINQINMFTASEIRRSFNTQPDYIPKYTRNVNPIKSMRISTPQYGFSMKGSPTFHQESPLLESSEFAFPDGSIMST